MNQNEKDVLEYLKQKRTWVSPTEIGLYVGGKTSSGLRRHSAWASPICKRLVKKGLVVRHPKGLYKAKDLD